MKYAECFQLGQPMVKINRWDLVMPFNCLSTATWTIQYPLKHAQSFAVLCFAVVVFISFWWFIRCIHPYSSRPLHWHWSFPEPMKYIDGSVQDCSNSTANALELLQSCTKTIDMGKICPHQNTNCVHHSWEVFCPIRHTNTVTTVTRGPSQ